ncbi:MAG TPA: restriction endonuclease subunit S [Bacteroidaceae bacterium]|nr:restriction endonuclease subunit S [Bacteroidaceae bacterium]HQL26624.1 restriction endonuclease subunit S [Bacteroidaceae bacterium]
MGNYTIQSTAINKNRVFILQKSELEKRLDPFYYVPELLELEKKVLAKKPKRLRDYVLSISSGATPKRDEEEKYYSDEENGIPFIRVQNVTEFGLDLSDVKFINKETHEGYLKRSQIYEGDLIVTITGRIASAAVAPVGFIGNTNQHSVVIKTESKEVSEILAAYLNCSIGQKLANRLATGGTRPALDYSALFSILIIEDKRILEITGNRFDPFYHQSYFIEVEKAIKTSKFNTEILRNQLSFIESGNRPKGGATRDDEGILSLGAEHVNSFCEVEVRTAKYIPLEFHQSILSTETKLNDILFVKDGATTGKVGMINKSEYVSQNINEHVFLLRPIPSINAFYLINYII